MVTVDRVDRLCPCGIASASAAPRCRMCPHGSAIGAASGAASGAGTVAAAGAGGVLMTYSRWKKSSGTFGPVGRVTATLLLLLPLPVLAMAVTVGIGIIGGGIYVLVIMPWALKDIWKKAAIPVSAPLPPASAPRF